MPGGSVDVVAPNDISLNFDDRKNSLREFCVYDDFNGESVADTVAGEVKSCASTEKKMMVFSDIESCLCSGSLGKGNFCFFNGMQEAPLANEINPYMFLLIQRIIDLRKSNDLSTELGICSIARLEEGEGGALDLVRGLNNSAGGKTDRPLLQFAIGRKKDGVNKISGLVLHYNETNETKYRKEIVDYARLAEKICEKIRLDTSLKAEDKKQLTSAIQNPHADGSRLNKMKAILLEVSKRKFLDGEEVDVMFIDNDRNYINRPGDEDTIKLIEKLGCKFYPLIITSTKSTTFPDRPHQDTEDAVDVKNVLRKFELLVGGIEPHQSKWDLLNLQKQIYSSSTLVQSDSEAEQLKDALSAVEGEIAKMRKDWNEAVFKTVYEQIPSVSRYSIASDAVELRVNTGIFYSRRRERYWGLRLLLKEPEVSISVSPRNRMSTKSGWLHVKVQTNDLGDYKYHKNIAMALERGVEKSKSKKKKPRTKEASIFSKSYSSVKSGGSSSVSQSVQSSKDSFCDSGFSDQSPESGKDNSSNPSDVESVESLTEGVRFSQLKKNGSALLPVQDAECRIAPTDKKSFGNNTEDNLDPKPEEANDISHEPHRVEPSSSATSNRSVVQHQQALHSDSSTASNRSYNIEAPKYEKMNSSFPGKAGSSGLSVTGFDNFAKNGVVSNTSRAYSLGGSIAAPQFGQENGRFGPAHEGRRSSHLSVHFGKSGHNRPPQGKSSVPIRFLGLSANKSVPSKLSTKKQRKLGELEKRGKATDFSILARSNSEAGKALLF